MMASTIPCFNALRTPLRQYILQPLTQQHNWRFFHSTRRRDVIKPFLLADIGEGIRECQIIQWFVQPGARVEQFDKVCEVQSDKAAVEITSPFDGVIKELHYEADDMAIVGKPLLDIDIQSEITPEDEAKLADTVSEAEKETLSKGESHETSPNQAGNTQVEREEIGGPLGRRDTAPESKQETPPPTSRYATLATPAVRHLTKELGVDIADVKGSGKDGRVLKEDVQRHHTTSKETSSATISDSHQRHQPPTASVSQQQQSPSASHAAQPPSSQNNRTLSPLTPLQTAMYKTMTRSLSIPHFLYTTPINLTPLSTLRAKLNLHRSDRAQKLSPLPFILKAVSQALRHHPLLNASLDTTTDAQKPTLVYNSSHDFGIAVDTPNGLVVPVLRGVQNLSVGEIAAGIKAISALAREGKLSAQDMQGATFTISNVGSIGGGVVAPVIVGPQVAILGVGRGRTVPAFDDEGRVVKREEAVFSWSADHRVVDGGECARAAERVRGLLEEVEGWVVDMR